MKETITMTVILLILSGLTIGLIKIMSLILGVDYNPTFFDVIVEMIICWFFLTLK